MKRSLFANSALIIGATAVAHFSTEPHTHSIIHGTEAIIPIDKDFLNSGHKHIQLNINEHDHELPDPSEYMYLLEMYDQWGVMFADYS